MIDLQEIGYFTVLAEGRCGLILCMKPHQVLPKKVRNNISHLNTRLYTSLESKRQLFIKNLNMFHSQLLVTSGKRNGIRKEKEQNKLNLLQNKKNGLQI